MSAPIDVQEIIFRYENGFEMKLSGEEARGFLEKSIGKVKNLDKYKWSVTTSQRSPVANVLFEKIMNLHRWFMKL